MPWPLLIPLITAGISAASSAFGAKKAADTAKKASATQSTAATAAAGNTNQALQQAMQYIAQQRGQPSGGSASGSLERLLGLSGAGSGASGMMPSQSATPYPFKPTMGATPDMSYRQMFGSGVMPAPGGGQAMNRQPMSGGGGGVVMLQAPNGAQKAVPADQVEHYLSRGARRIG